MKAFITIVDEDTGRTYVNNQLLPPSSITKIEECLCTRYYFSFEFVKVNTNTTQAILFEETKSKDAE